MGAESTDKWEGRLAIATLVLATLSLLWRIRFGIDLTDESFYIALPYRFALGDTPFVDELNILQTSALLTWPLVKLYVLATGGTDGIMLFMRHAYVAFVLVTTLVVFSSLRAFLRWPQALLVASICLVFVPFNIPNLSYNSMGAGFFAMGCFLGLKAIIPLPGDGTTQPTRPASLCLAGLCHALSVVAYPTMIVAAIAYLLVLVTLLQARREILWYVVGAMPVAVGAAGVLAHAGGDALLESLRYTRTRPVGGGLEKLIAVLEGLGVSLLYGSLTIVLAGVATFLRRRGSGRAVYLMAVLPISALAGRYGFSSLRWSLGVMLNLGLLAVFFYAFVRRGRYRQLFFLVTVPSCLAGVVLSYTSSNGYISAAMGLLPAALTGLVYMAAIVAEAPGMRRWVSLVLCTLVCALGASQYARFYREDGYPSLVAQVQGGPYAGLSTNPARQRQVAALGEALRSVLRPSDQSIFFYGFPGGYLFTGLRPAARNVWTDRIDLDDVLHRFEGGGLPTIIVENINRRPFRGETLDGPTRDERLRRFLEESGYAHVAAVEGFEVYRRD